MVFLREEREGGGVGEGELGGSALRFTENSQQLVAECVRAHGRPATVPALFFGGVGRGGGGREGRISGGVAGRLALPGTKWASVFSANLPLDGNFGSR